MNQAEDTQQSQCRFKLSIVKYYGSRIPIIVGVAQLLVPYKKKLHFPKFKVKIEKLVGKSGRKKTSAGKKL